MTTTHTAKRVPVVTTEITDTRELLLTWKRTTRRATAALLLGCALLPLVPALAQTFPARSITLVVPGAAGGTGDALSRLVSEGMARELGQAVVVENKSGAGGLTGTQGVARAAADGYTLLGTSPSHVINPILHAPRKTYDALKDFEPVTVLARTHQMIVAHPSVPFRDLVGLIDYAKRNPGKLNYGSAGMGSATHLNMELFLSMAGISITHVPYKGSSQARQDVLSGQVQVAVDGLGPALPLIKGGRLIAIGLMSSVRAQSNPEIPTIGEIIPGYASETWYGILAPAGTPRDVVARLNAAAVKVIASRSVSEQFQKLGAEAVGNTPEQFRRMLESEQKVWSKVVRDSGAKAE